MHLLYFFYLVILLHQAYTYKHQINKGFIANLILNVKNIMLLNYNYI